MRHGTTPPSQAPTSSASDEMHSTSTMRAAPRTPCTTGKVRTSASASPGGSRISYMISYDGSNRKKKTALAATVSQLTPKPSCPRAHASG